MHSRPAPRWSAGGRRSLALVLLCGACQHSDPPLSPRDTGSSDPRSAAEPVQLTYNHGPDLAPAWSADGGTILYSYTIPAGPESANRCLASLPATGGSRTAERCSSTQLSPDSITALQEPAMSPEGRLAWVETGSERPGVTPDRAAIMVGSFARNAPPQAVLTLPYTAPSGNVHATATHLRWLDASHLAYVGSDQFFLRACLGCKLDTVVVGREIMTLDVSSGAAPVPVAGTDRATSVWPGPAGTSVYFTVAGETRIWQVNLTGDAPVLVHDFGAAGIARDVSAAGNRLVAVVGGRVRLVDDPTIGDRVYDDGGRITLVDLGTGQESNAEFLGDTVARHAVIAPDGLQVVVEKFDSVNTDLYRLPLP